MEPVGGPATTSEESRLLEEISALRGRVRARHREHALWAALVGLVALGGAAAFLLAAQIRQGSCQPPEQAAVICGWSSGPFTLWWYWPLAAAAAVVFALARRHRRGTWRMSPLSLLIALLVLMFLLLTVVPLMGAFVPPVTYPLTAAAALAFLAVSRHNLLGTAAASAAGAGVLFIEFNLTALTTMDRVTQVLLRNNLGLAASSLLVGLAALLTAGAWAVRQHR